MSHNTTEARFAALRMFVIGLDVINRADDVLCRTIDIFLKGLSPVDRYIFTARYGYQAPYQTLQEVGESIYAKISSGELEGEVRSEPYTREWIRQIQAGLIADLQEMLESYSGVLKSVIWTGYDLLNGPFLPKLRARFTGCKDADKCFNRFLAGAGQFEESAIEDLSARDVSPALMDRFWVTYPPDGSRVGLLQIEDMHAYLQEHHGFTMLKTRNYVYQLLTSGRLAVEDDLRLRPCGLSKAYAFSHVVHGFPNGAAWKLVQRRVNDLQICAKTLSETRLDHGASSAVDNGWIYQSNQGEYGPIANFNAALSKEKIPECLDIIKQLIAKEAGYLSPVALSVLYGLYFDEIAIDDYYVLRHLVRHYGGAHGIYFKGKSGADVVSLSQDFEILSKQDAILEAFSDGCTFKAEDVAPLLRSQSSRHAAYLIDCLVRDKKVTKVAKGVYCVTGILDDAIDVEKVMASVQAILAGLQGERVAYDDLYEAVEKALGDTGIRSASHLASIIRSSRQRYKGYWEFVSNYVTYTA